MCIRDRVRAEQYGTLRGSAGFTKLNIFECHAKESGKAKGCLLYTSDAADERSSVDLGGRRIIKKKKTEESSGRGGLRVKITPIEES